MSLSPSIFDTINRWLPNPPDWCTPIKAQTFASIILAYRPEVVVEIGVWKGTSCIPMALACREAGKGVVHAIDPWKAEASIVGMDEVNRAWWSKVDHDAVYGMFMQNVNHFGLHGIIQIHRQKSDDVAPPENIGFLHCDGNHGEQAARDASRYGRNVVLGGFAFMDDLDWQGQQDGVNAGCKRLIEMGFIQIYTLEKGAMFQRISK